MEPECLKASKKLQTTAGGTKPLSSDSYLLYFWEKQQWFRVGDTSETAALEALITEAQLPE